MGMACGLIGASMPVMSVREACVVLAAGLACWLGSAGALASEEPSAEPNSVGLSVEPGGLLIQQVQPGQQYDVAAASGVALKVSNRDARPRTYRVSAHRPSAVGNGKWLSGYEEIPDPSWFQCEPSELSVGPGAEGYARMSLRVPEEERYYNQAWTVSIGVRGVPQPGEMLALAAFPRYQIETEAGPDVTEAPEGLLGLAPSVLRIEGLQPGLPRMSRLMLYNSDAVTHRYAISARVIRVEAAREQIVPSPGHQWIPDFSWVDIQEPQVSVGAGQRRPIEFSVTIPNQPEVFGQRWEALVWVEPDSGAPRFARAQISAAASGVAP